MEPHSFERGNYVPVKHPKYPGKAASMRPHSFERGNQYAKPLANRSLCTNRVEMRVAYYFRRRSDYILKQAVIEDTTQKVQCSYHDPPSRSAL